MANDRIDTTWRKLSGGYTATMTVMVCSLDLYPWSSHSCQVSQFGRDSPGIWLYVPVVSLFA